MDDADDVIRGFYVYVHKDKANGQISPKVQNAQIFKVHKIHHNLVQIV